MADLPQQETINQYTADGIEDVFTYSFLVPTDVDVDVFVTPAGQQANDDADIKILNTDYTVQDAGNINGGTITFQPGFIPALGDVVTFSRAVEASIDTSYEDARTIVGENLDTDFGRVTLVAQQNQTKFDTRSLRYNISSTVSESTVNNIVPTLDPGYIWKGVLGGGVGAFFLEENPDCSTLRSELESEAQGSDGASIVGYFNEETLSETDVANNLNTINPIVLNLSNNDILSSGALLVGYFDPVSSTSTNVKDNLDFINNTIANTSLDQTGEIIQTMNPVIPAGWIQYLSYTIGSDSSGATYANNDSQDLYEMFWNNYPDAICPVTGGRGSSATDDFNANKPLLMPDVNDRIFANTGSYFLGETFGENDHELTIDEMPSHNHNMPNTYVNNSGTGLTVTAGSGLTVNNPSTASTGNNQPHENRQPSIAVITRIKL